MDNDKIRYALRNDESAVAFFIMLRGALHFWDDLIDKNRPVSPEAINGVMFSILVDLPNNAFYREHFDELRPILTTAIANWSASNEFEAGDDIRRLQIAFIARSDYINILIYCTYLVGGRAWMLEMAPLIRDQWTVEDFPKYLDNLGYERADRTGDSTELVKAHYEQETGEYIRHGVRVFSQCLAGGSEETHIRSIYERSGVTPGAVIVDMGCGIGAISEGIKKLDSSATIYCVSNVAAQIDEVSKGVFATPVYCDYHRVTLGDSTADWVMFNESIGYGRLSELLAEAKRLLKPGGVVTIRDGVVIGGSRFMYTWRYLIHGKGVLDTLARGMGFEVEYSEETTDFTCDKYDRFVKESPVMASRYTVAAKRDDTPLWFWRLRKIQEK